MFFHRKNAFFGINPKNHESKLIKTLLNQFLSILTFSESNLLSHRISSKKEDIYAILFSLLQELPSFLDTQVLALSLALILTH